MFLFGMSYRYRSNAKHPQKHHCPKYKLKLGYLKLNKSQLINIIYIIQGRIANGNICILMFYVFDMTIDETYY